MKYTDNHDDERSRNSGMEKQRAHSEAEACRPQGQSMGC